MANSQTLGPNCLTTFPQLADANDEFSPGCMSRGAKPPRRCGLLGRSACYPQGNFLSVERWHFHSHTTGSLTPTFVSARPVSLAVRLAFAFALSSLVSVQAERTFERLRYFLGGDRPSQTAHLTMSPASIQRRRLEFQCRKDGIPTSAPESPKRLFPSVPSILCMQHRKPNIRLQ